MSDFKNMIKNKVRSSAHSQLIDSTPIDLQKVDKKKKFEDAYTRQTYYIENDLLKKLSKLAGKEKGEKTRIINAALRMYISSQT